MLAALAFPFLPAAKRLRQRQRWSARLLDVLGIRLQADEPFVVPGCLLVANHVSWIDVFVINAAYPAAFVSKAEVRQWPLIGWLAAKNETVFLRRGSRGHARIVNGEIGALLGQGRHVAIFPEGTTTDGSHVLGFHAALLQPAIEAGAPIQPLAIAYRLPDGRHTRAPAYDGDISLLDCIKAIIAEPEIIARVRVAPAIPPGALPDRKAIAHAAREAIVARIGD
ncbi:1-acyl-sn-glycerol-3-phosphate acyltransferase [Zoogloea sp. LCSB751]|uniref:lysophospholipid acyltransferase family protein n=1 Tax=Zoogloea sp. LCSB751 TaxID=1965277 RepID=UPI0015700B06|nr:lysophospholipid acyltransferase family protein [Zoogloea sp. LCSB751]